MKGTTKIYKIAEAVIGVAEKDYGDLVFYQRQAIERTKSRSIRALQRSQQFLTNVKKPRFRYNKKYEHYYQDEE